MTIHVHRLGGDGDTHAHVAPEPREANRVRTAGDVLDGLVADLATSGAVIDASQLAWAISEYTRRMTREFGRCVVAGRIR